MKKKTILFLAAIALLFAQAEEDEYTAYVQALYVIGVGERSVLTFGGEEFEVFGADIQAEKMSISDAALGYYAAYNKLSSILGGTTLNKTIRAYTLAKWAELMDAILYQGLAAQHALDVKFQNDLAKEAKDSQELMNEAQALYAKRLDESEETATRLNAAATTISASLNSTRADMETLANDTKAELESVNNRISELVSKGSLDFDEKQELEELKKQASKLSVVMAAANKASSEAQAAAVKAASYDARITRLETLGASTNNWKAVSAWLGQKDEGKRTNRGVFLEPKRVDTGSDASGGENYDHTKGDTLFTMLKDLGVVPFVNDEQREAWKELGGGEPRQYFYKSETGSSREDKCFASPLGSFPAPSNWADGETIVCTNGVYVASAAKGFANVAKTLQGLLNNANAKGITGAGSDAQIGDGNLWSTNNMKNPANPNFDREDRTNPWNLATYTGDSQVSPKDYRHLQSIDFLGEYSSAFGNAFSLYGFATAPNGAVPYVERTETDSTLLWKKELEADGGEETTYGAERPKTLQSFKSADDDSENVDSEMTRYLSLYGFTGAETGQVPYKKSETELGWKEAGGGAFKFVGTDGGEGVTVGSGATTNTITFASASDSNVKVKVAGGGSYVNIEIGVYYK